MSLRHGLLGLLGYASYTGYDLCKVFDESLHFFWKAQPSQIYRELNEMEKLGWVASTIIVQSDNPNKRVYSLSDAGRAELARWLADDGGVGAPIVRNAFLMKVFFSGGPGGEKCLEKLEKFKAANERALRAMADVGENIAAYEAAADGSDGIYWGLAADFGRRAYQTNIEWAAAAIARLEEENARTRRKRKPERGK